MKELLVTNIQRFSLHDGPGIRSTVFFKGCSLKCPWCSNPESILMNEQAYVKDEVRGIYGHWYDCQRLYREIIKDRDYFGTKEQLTGGVTFSGGEPMLQMKVLEPLLKELENDNIHMVVETSLFAPEEAIKLAIKYIDLFIVDLKILDSDRCERILGGNLDVFFKNFAILMQSGKKVVIRIPVIGGFTDDEKNRRKIVDFLGSVRGNIERIELLKEHSLGMTKYQALLDGGNDIKIPEYKGVDEALLEEYKNQIEKITNICTIVQKI